jgi:hypothetical protein
MEERHDEPEIENGSSIFDIVPFVQKMTRIEDYEMFRNVRAFIKERYSLVPCNRKGTPLAVNEWMDHMGYRNKAKFLRRLSEWTQLVGLIPLKFLELTGIKVDQLKAMLELDKLEYQQALKLAVSPRYFQYRVMACVYPVVRFPQGISEEDAIGLVQSFLKEKKIPNANINYYLLKTIWVKPDSYETVYYEPQMSIKREHISFETPCMPGSVSVR